MAKPQLKKTVRPRTSTDDAARKRKMDNALSDIETLIVDLAKLPPAKCKYAVGDVANVEADFRSLCVRLRLVMQKQYGIPY